MDIKEFVSKVLTDLVEAVEQASSQSTRAIKLAETKDSRTVEFDIAVAVEENTTAEGRAGIKVLHFIEGGGNLSEESKSSTVSRVQFGVTVDVWTKKETQDHERISYR